MKLQKLKGHSTFRKIAMGSWNTVGDPTVYGLLEIDMSSSLEFLKMTNAAGPKVGVTELVAKAIASVMKERPEMNGLIRWGRIYLRTDIDIFFQVNVPGAENDPIGKADLLGVVIKNVDQKSLIQLSDELKSKSKSIKAGHESEITRASRILSFVPWRLMKFVLNLTSFLTYDLLLPVKKIGLPADPFGSIMITNVGSLGVDTAWAPLVPYTRCPLLLTVGAIQNRPWVDGDKIVIRPILRIGCTFDHRFMDGVHAAAMAKKFKHLFEHPELLEK